MPPSSQALLKRRAGTTVEAFQEAYKRHGHLVIPWCLDNGVMYYAQIHNPRWASEEVAGRYVEVAIEDFDAAAEMAFPKQTSIRFGDAYHKNVVLPDERRILFSEAMEHLKMVDAGSVVGTRLEFIVEGKPTVAFEEWQARWDETQKQSQVYEGALLFSSMSNYHER